MPKKYKLRGIIGLDDTATPQALELFLDDANGQDIEVEFNSPGGFVFFGLEMANMIRNYPGRTVAHIVGLAASMSSYIPMMFDEIIVEDNAIMMIHNPMAGAFGIDYRGAEKLFNRLKALRDLLGKAYSDKSDKDMPEMRKVMDDETFLYGQEIVDAGFADSVSESSNKDKTKASAIAVAEEEIISCIASMKASETTTSDDFERAAAFINKEAPKPPAAAGKPKEEAVRMKSLKELLAENPDAKAEHEAAILAADTKARAEGETAGIEKGKDEMKATIAKVAPFLNSAEYPTVGEIAINVLKGEASVVTLDATVAAVDAVKEQMKEKGAIGEQSEETLAAAPDADKTQENYQAKKDRLKEA